MKLLYGEYYQADHRIKKLWRITFLVATFVSMLHRAYDKIKHYGAIHNVSPKNENDETKTKG